MKFADLGLSDELLQSVLDAGYDEPTPIQAQAIPAVLMMKDIIGIAQTGTGKTAGFVLPMIDILAHGRRRALMPRSLILEPTRELAAQVAENFEKYGKNHDLKMALLIGGVQMGDQVKALQDGVDVLIATPGRLMDLFERGKILLTGCDLLVIDMPDLHADVDYDEELAQPAPRPATVVQHDEDDPFADLRDMQQTAAAEPDFEPAPAPPPYAPPQPEQPTSSAVLAIQLGAQEQLRHLPRARLMELLQRYRDCLERAAALYQGKLFTLSDGSSLMLFSSEHSGDDYLTHALCCGELMRALGHALQIEVADSGITLQLQLGLTRSDEAISPSQAELLLSEAAQDALALAQHSRNLLLVQRSVADDPLLRQRARIRAIASPEGASCVERLLEPYPSLLERQLARMHEHS